MVPTYIGTARTVRVKVLKYYLKYLNLFLILGKCLELRTDDAMKQLTADSKDPGQSDERLRSISFMAGVNNSDLEAY